MIFVSIVPNLPGYHFLKNWMVRVLVEEVSMTFSLDSAFSWWNGRHSWDHERQAFHCFGCAVSAAVVVVVVVAAAAERMMISWVAVAVAAVVAFAVAERMMISSVVAAAAVVA